MVGFGAPHKILQRPFNVSTKNIKFCDISISSTCRGGHPHTSPKTWWRHQMEKCSVLLALCDGNPPITEGFPSQRPVTRSLDVFFDLRLNKRLSKKMETLVIWDAIALIIMSLEWYTHDLLFGMVCCVLLTHGTRKQMTAILQTSFSNSFSSMKIISFWFKFQWHVFLWVQQTMNHQWLRYWLGTE